MTIGERIKAFRKASGLSQEKVAELVGVSRQAVTKWESGKSAPSTENLFRLAEIFGTTVDMLLDKEEHNGPEKKQDVSPGAEKKHRSIKNTGYAALTALAYAAVYLTGRFIWCDISASSFIGWLIYSSPSGENSYLYGWLISSGMFGLAMAVSVIPAFFGKRRFSAVTLAAFVLGMAAGIIFGPNPRGESYGQGHYGWAIWGAIYFLSVLMGIILEISKSMKKRG